MVEGQAGLIYSDEKEGTSVVCGEVHVPRRNCWGQPLGMSLVERDAEQPVVSG